MSKKKITRTEVINIRFMPQDVSKLQELASKKGIALSTYCYLLIKEVLDANTNDE